MATAIKLNAKNIAKVKAALAKRKMDLDTQLSPVARGITQVLLGMVQKRFAEAARGNPPSDWKPMSKFTRFIRSHREGAKNSDPKLLNDKGLLRNTNFPFVRGEGTEFGIVNNTKYASTHQFGGTTSGGTVRIGAFMRKGPSGKPHRVKAYSMKVGSHKVPARPFFPTKDEYMPQVLTAIRRYVRLAANPNA